MASKPPNPPDAFLSYTRFDDHYHHGAISEFRDQLSLAVRAVTAQPFEIFRDIEGIGLGEVWREVLDNKLDQARFFIPVLTPNYFGSEACRDELQKFAELERNSARNDLILPIYYLTCTVLENKERCAADPLATLIDARQRFDWRDLRHHSFRTRKVKLELEALANRVDDARHRGIRKKADAEPRATEEDAQSRTTNVLAVTARKQTKQHLQVGTVFRDKDAPWCPELVVIPPGEFMMGSTEAERQWAVEQGAKPEWLDPEKPQHLVRIAYPLAVGRYPVTFDEYAHFARTTGRAQPGDEGWGRGRHPVINVDLKDAKSFIAWLSVQSGQAYRLLSEAEWEYACRAGTMTRYWWGDEITPENANYGANVGKTSEVGSYSANPFGLYDMHGNVWEWVEDRWHDSYAGAPNDGSAWILGTEPHVVLRGGAWFNGPRVVRSAVRIRDNPDYRYYFVGFRVARMPSRSEGVTP